MVRIIGIAALVMSLAACGPGDGTDPDAERSVAAFAPDYSADVSILARYPGPTFLENLAVLPDRSVLLSNYTAKRVDRWHPEDGGSAFARLNDHPVAILPLGPDYLITAHGRPFTEGEAVIGSGVLLGVDAAGVVQDRIEVPQAGFLNGMTELGDGTVLIADSVRGQILRFDPASRGISQWFSDPDLAPRLEPGFIPGTNGLKRLGDAIYVSCSAKRTLYRLRIGPGEQAIGPLTPVTAALPGADDFEVLPDGRFLVATHQDRVILADQFGMMTTVTDDPIVAGSTAVALWGTGRDRRLLILGTGGFSEGGTGDAALVMARLPE